MTYSYLNYNDDYDLDVVPVPQVSGGRKFLFSQTRHKIQVPIMVKGSMIMEAELPLSIHGKSKYSLTPTETTYSGHIIISESFQVNGKSSYPIEEKITANGTSKITTDTTIIVEGKKDYTKVIQVLEDFIKTPFITSFGEKPEGIIYG